MRERGEVLTVFDLTASCYFELLLLLLCGEEMKKKQMFIRLAAFLTIFRGSSEVSLSHHMKIKLMDLAAPAAHRDREVTLSSLGRGRRGREALRPLHVPSGSQSSSWFKPRWPQACQYCSLPLDSQLPDLQPITFTKHTSDEATALTLPLKVLPGRAVWIVWSAPKYSQHDLEWLTNAFRLIRALLPNTPELVLFILLLKVPTPSWNWAWAYTPFPLSEKHSALAFCWLLFMLPSQRIACQHSRLCLPW